MRSASVSEAKNGLSALLREVQGGATVVITDRGVPVARLVPAVSTRGVSPRLVALAQQGLAVLPEVQPAAAWLKLPRPRLGPGPSPVDLMLEERREGR
jgi:prevent-host-death family protein